MPGLLELQRLEILYNLRLDFVEGLVHLVLYRKIVGLDFRLRGFADFGIDRLLEQLIS